MELTANTVSFIGSLFVIGIIMATMLLIACLAANLVDNATGK